MYCPNCGTKNVDNTFRCVKCNEVIQYIPVQPDVADDPAMRMILPVGRSILAIAAGYAGLFAILIFPAPIALILGILAVIDMKKHPEKHGMGRAVFALIMGGFFTVMLFFFVLMFILAPRGT